MPGIYRQFVLPVVVYFVFASVVCLTTQTFGNVDSNNHRLPISSFDDRAAAPAAAQSVMPMTSISSEPSETSTQTATDSADIDTSNVSSEAVDQNTASIPQTASTSNIGSAAENNISNISSSPGFEPTGVSSIETPITQTQNTPADNEALIDQIIAAQRRGDLEAIAQTQNLLLSAHKVPPEDSADGERLNQLGLRALKSKRYEEAAGFFRNASKDDSSDPKFLSNLGFAELSFGQIDLAEKHLRSSLALDPRRSVAWDDLGLTLAKKEKQDDAVSCFLLGYQFSDGKVAGFLRTLENEVDPRVQAVGKIVNAKLPPVSN